MTLSERIKAEAHALGFTAAAIVPVGTPKSHAFYRDWVAAGYAGTMSYLEEHVPLKQDPATLLPGAQSLILVTLNYLPPAQPEVPDAPRGRVARYAWGSDYHEVLWRRLDHLAETLAGWVKAETGKRMGWRTFADSAPLMEREFAARGGLGWVGKNGNLIHWEHGSWLFIGEALVDVALDPDIPDASRTADPAALLPLRESCGTCTACIEACPTQAIVADKTVDARRCISYLTIELRGPIPTELRRGMGDWVFGCDVCQQVCPWNRDVPASTEPAFAGSAERAYPDLPDLLAMDTASFRSRFKGTPLLRTRRSGLVRNAAIALGNWLTGREATHETVRARTALRHALADREPTVRGAAAWALGQAGQDASSLQAALAGEADPQVREELIAALSTNPTTATSQENR